jgi:1-acyl-sn-glycerol-3-phosphate acyltransferase
VGKGGPERRLAWLARILGWLTAPFVRYRLRGGRCADELTVAIIAANHRSLFDVVAGLICLHRFGHYPRLLIERKYVEGTWTGPLARAIGAIPVDRGGGAGALDAAITELRNGVPVLVMPEGRLHWDPDDPLSTGPAKTGVSRLAVGSGQPVVPAGLAGTERVMPAHARFPRLNPFRRKVVVANVADDPMWLEGDDHRVNTERVMVEVRALLAVASADVDGGRGARSRRRSRSRSSPGAPPTRRR